MPQTYSDGKAFYSVDMMFAYLKNHKYPVTEINVNDYIDFLNYPGWGGMVDRYSAMNVIDNPKKYPQDYRRIQNADLSYPIIIADNNIIDGFHRLTKAYLDNIKTIKSYIFDDELFQKFKLMDETEEAWNKIDNMPLYEIIDLYYKRFCHNNMKGGSYYHHKYLKYNAKLSKEILD